MKRIIIFFFIGVFFIFISKYIFENFTPFNKDALQELITSQNIQPGQWDQLNQELLNLVQRGLILDYLSPNAYIGLGSVLVSIFSFFVSIHLIIDKIFFKDYFEPALLSDAIRRGIFLLAALILIAYTKLLHVELYIIALIPVVFIILEIFYQSYFKKFMEFRKTRLQEMEQKDKQEQKEENTPQM